MYVWSNVLPRQALTHLRRLSLRELPKLSQNLVLEVVKTKGQHLESFLLGGSTAALTDKSVAAIAQHCNSILNLDFDSGSSISNKSFSLLTSNCKKLQVRPNWKGGKKDAKPADGPRDMHYSIYDEGQP